MPIHFRTCATFAAVVLLTTACGDLAAEGQQEVTDGKAEAVVGGEAIHGPRSDFLGAVGALVGPGGCTGTLVAPNKVLFAAHCTCGSLEGWTFALPHLQDVPASRIGVLDCSGADATAQCFSGTAVRHPEFNCSSDNLEQFRTAGTDLAVLTLDNPVPASLATPQPVYLGQFWADFLGTGGIAAGFGNFAEDFHCNDSPIIGISEFTRRQWTGFGIAEEYDPCDALFFEGACADVPYYFSPVSSPMRLGRGDSGSALFGIRHGIPMVIGVWYGNKCPETGGAAGIAKHVWAETADRHNFFFNRPLGHNAVWIAENIDLPFATTVEEIRSMAALFSNNILRLNDRASVLSQNPSGAALTVTATGPAMGRGTQLDVGVEAQTRNILAGGKLSLNHRAVVNGDISATFYLKQPDAVVTGAEHFDTVIRVPDALESVTLIQSTTSSQDISLNTPSGGAVNTLAIAPGHYRDIRLKPFTRLQLSAGVYVVRNFLADTDSIVEFSLLDATYLVVTGSFLWRGTTNGGQGLIGLKSGGKIENFITGTIVSPSSQHAVVVDTAGDGPAMLGAIFAGWIEIHQGKQIKHVPFGFPWAPALQ